MNSNYYTEYIGIDGKIKIRSTIARIRTIIFTAIKYFSDRLLALLGLIILSPIMLISAIAIKLEDRGPALFKQPRTGKSWDLTK